VVECSKAAVLVLKVWHLNLNKEACPRSNNRKEALQLHSLSKVVLRVLAVSVVMPRLRCGKFTISSLNPNFNTLSN
jgi:hypothetical protein